MEFDELYQAMLTLNPYESIGQEYQEKTGAPLDYAQFLFLLRYPQPYYTLGQLLSPKAVAEQQEMRSYFRSSFGDGLTEEFFLAASRRIEIDKLQRYIDIPMHRHDFVECAFVLSGSCHHMVGGFDYVQTQGSCTVIPQGVEHHLVPDGDCVCLTVKLRYALFKQMDIPNLNYFIYPISFQCGPDSLLRTLLLTIYVQQETGQLYYEKIMEQMFQTTMTYIMQNYQDTMQHLVTHAAHDRQMLEILNYAYENYQTISQRSLAEHFHFNASYLSNYIHQQTGQTFTNILKEFKLKHAAQFLINTNLPLNDICTNVGYKDVSQFIRSFKAMYGVTPLQYRKTEQKIATVK